MANGYINIPGLGGSGGNVGDGHWKAPAADFASLPLVDNNPGDARVTLDTSDIFIWDGSAWVQDMAIDTNAIYRDNSQPPTTDISWDGFNLEDFGSLISSAAIPAVAGTIRLGNTESIAWRNNADTNDANINFNASHQFEFNGIFNNNDTTLLAKLYAGPYGDSAILEMLGDFSGVPGGSSKIICKTLMSNAYEAANPGEFGEGLFLELQGKVRFNDVTFASQYANTVYITNGTNSSVIYADNLIHVENAFVHGDIFQAPATVGAIRLLNNDTISWRNAASSANLGITLSVNDDFVFTAPISAPAFYSQGIGSSAASGVIRLFNNQAIAWRNNADSADISLYVGTDDSLYLNSNLIMSSFLQMAQHTTPSNPPALSNKLYFKSDNNLYMLNSAGSESQVNPVTAFITSISDTASVDLTVTGTDLSALVIPGGVDHNALANLSTGDVHTQYSLLAGRAGGQIQTGGTAASNNLVLRSTSNVTKGQVYLDEVTDSSSISTGALRVDGGVGIAKNLYVGDHLRVGDGTVGAPSLSFDSDSNSGFYKYIDGSIAVSSNGVVHSNFYNDGVEKALQLQTHLAMAGDNTKDIGNYEGGLTDFARPRNIYVGTSVRTPNGTYGAPPVTFTADTATGWYTTAANVIALSSGTGTQKLQFGESTSGGTAPSNIENTSGNILIVRGGGNTINFIVAGVSILSLYNDGTESAFLPQRNLAMGTDNTLDIGNFSGGLTDYRRPRNIFVGTSVSNADGSNSVPSYTFTNDPNTGFYSSGADQIGATTGGTNRLTLDSTALSTSVDVVISTAGKGLTVKSGSNAKIGTVVLDGSGTNTVSNTSVTANSLIFVTAQVQGGTTVLPHTVNNKIVGTSFDILYSVGDTSTVAYMIVEAN